MADVRMRPRFRRAVPCDPDAVLASIAELVGDPHSAIEGRVFDSSAVLRPESSSLRFWSPQLQLSVDRRESEGEGTLVLGLFGPHPTIWSLFVALYVAAGFLGTMGALFGYAQWILDRPATALWTVPAAGALAAMTYVVARTGRRLGSDQTRLLYDAVNARMDALCAQATVPSSAP